MLDLVSGLLGGFWKELLAGLGVVVGLFAARRSGVKSERLKNAQQTDKRERQARDAIRDGRDSGLTSDERLRRNDDDWRGV